MDDQPGTVEKIIVATAEAPGPTEGAPYSQAVEFGELVFVSGQLPVDRTTRELVSGGIAEQTHQVMENLAAVLAEAGSDMGRLLKTTVFLVDRSDWPAMNAVYGTYVGDRPPARSAVISRELGFGARVEIDAVAYKARP
jgi:2-iminobutanoate/2-iminopropanoate deaminase